jgi:hypothetical protein
MALFTVCDPSPYLLEDLSQEPRVTQSRKLSLESRQQLLESGVNTGVQRLPVVVEEPELGEVLHDFPQDRAEYAPSVDRSRAYADSSTRQQRAHVMLGFGPNWRLI